jgi:hypothetical protein
MFRPTKPVPLAEFIVVLAFMVFIVEKATDIMLGTTKPCSTKQAGYRVDLEQCFQSRNGRNDRRVRGRINHHFRST